MRTKDTTKGELQKKLKKLFLLLITRVAEYPIVEGMGYSTIAWEIGKSLVHKGTKGTKIFRLLYR